MESTTDGGQTDPADQNEPRKKGGVAGTDSKDFDSDDPFKEPKPDKKDPIGTSS